MARRRPPSSVASSLTESVQRRWAHVSGPSEAAGQQLDFEGGRRGPKTLRFSDVLEFVDLDDAIERADARHAVGRLSAPTLTGPRARRSSRSPDRWPRAGARRPSSVSAGTR